MTTAIKSFFIEQILKWLSPESFSPEKIRVNAEDFEKADQTCTLIQPGDLIFTKTPGNLYEVLRMIVGMEYDHISVALSKKEIIHISMPNISRVPVRFLTLSRQNPLIVRLRLAPEVLSKFIGELHNFLGEKYSYGRVGQIAKKFLKVGGDEAPTFDLENLKERRICGNVVLYCLCKASPEINGLVQQQALKTNYAKIGDFLPDSILDILKVDHNFEEIHREKGGRSNHNSNVGKELMQILLQSNRGYKEKLMTSLSLLRKLDIKGGDALKLASGLLFLFAPIAKVVPRNAIVSMVRKLLTVKKTTEDKKSIPNPLRIIKPKL